MKVNGFPSLGVGVGMSGMGQVTQNTIISIIRALPSRKVLRSEFRISSMAVLLTLFFI